MAMVNIEGLDKAEVVLALYNASHHQGRLCPHHVLDAELDVESIRIFLNEDDAGYFDYLNGRTMKVDLRGEVIEFDPCLFDRDNYEGAAQDAINRLRVSRNKEILVNG